MKNKLLQYGALLMALLWSVRGFSVLTEGPLRGENVGYSPDWPAGLKEVVTGRERVYGAEITVTWGRGYEEVCLCYAGDYRAFNEFVEKFAALKITPLTLVLYPEQGKTGALLYEERTIPFDWQVRIAREGWRPEAGEKGAGGYRVTLELYLGGQVKLEMVKVPLAVDVKCGGAIARFIAAHEAKRKDAKIQE